MIKSTLSRDSLTLIFQRCFGVFLQILLTFFLARRMDVDSFSKWSFVQSLILIFSLLDFPIVSALQNTFVAYDYAHKNKEEETLFFSLLQIATLTALFMTPTLFLGNVSWMIPLIAFLLTKSLFQFAKASYFVRGQIFYFSMYEMISHTFATLFVFIALYYKIDSQILFTGYCALFALGAIYAAAIFYLRRKWRWITCSQMKVALRPLIRPITLLFFQNIAMILLFSTDGALIYFFFGSLDVSQFYLYQRIFNGVLLITLTITTAAFVRFASDYERGDRAKVAKTLFAICRVCSLIILAIGGSICLSHEKLITGLSGHLWGNSSYCIAFMVNVTLVTFQSIFSTALNAMGYYKGQLHLYLVLLLIKASILYIFSAHLQASHILWITSGILLPMIGGNLWTIYQILARKSAIRGDSRE